MEEASFDDGADVIGHFKITVKDNAKVFGGGADIGDESVRDSVGGDGVMVENYDFSFILVECQEVIVHPSLDIVKAVEQWLE